MQTVRCTGFNRTQLGISETSGLGVHWKGCELRSQTGQDSNPSSPGPGANSREEGPGPAIFGLICGMGLGKF